MGRLSQLTVLCVLTLTACGTGPGAPPLPHGFTRFHGPGYTFAVPPGWVRGTGTDQQGAALVVYGDPRSGAAITLDRVAHYTGTLGEHIRTVLDLNTLFGRHILQQHPVRVAGAASAHRIDAVYAAPVQTQITDVYAITHGGIMLDLTVRAPVAMVQTYGLSHVLDSFRATS